RPARSRSLVLDATRIVRLAGCRLSDIPAIPLGEPEIETSSAGSARSLAANRTARATPPCADGWHALVAGVPGHACLSRLSEQPPGYGKQGSTSTRPSAACGSPASSAATLPGRATLHELREGFLQRRLVRQDVEHAAPLERRTDDPFEESGRYIDA